MYRQSLSVILIRHDAQTVISLSPVIPIARAIYIFTLRSLVICALTETADVLLLCQIAGKSIVIYYSAVGGMKSLPFRFHFERIKPPRLNYAALYPIAKRIWDCFSQNIVRPVNIGVNQSTLLTI